MKILFLLVAFSLHLANHQIRIAMITESEYSYFISVICKRIESTHSSKQSFFVQTKNNNKDDRITLSVVEEAIPFFNRPIQLLTNSVSPTRQRIAFNESAIPQRILSGSGDIT